MTQPNLFKSRKFWIMIVDVAVSTATYLITSYVNPELADKLIWLIAAWQPVIISVITGIATEDAARLSQPK